MTRASSASSDRAVLVAVALSGTLLPLNSTMLAVALPDIASGLGSGVAATTWLVTTYVVAMATLGPFAGRLGDRLGPRRVILAGLGAFAVASAVAGLAPSLGVLVAETTAPPWTPLFATVAAVVTDTGGVLSHCAVVAREYGIPAVVGTQIATVAIRDGDTIEVDGDAGIVRIV